MSIPLLLLALSVVALIVGPLIHRLARSNAPMLAALDGFNVVAISGLVFLHGLPDAFAHAGWGALLAAGLGFIGPTLLERNLHRIADKAHAGAILLALAGLTVHALIDGTAIAHSNELGLAVVLHRVPVSLTIWMLLLSKTRSRTRIAALGIIALATLVGFGASDAVLREATIGFGLFAGLVSGSLLHVVVHGPTRSTAPRGTWAWSAGLGALGGLGLLYGVQLLHGPHAHGSGHSVGDTFVALAATSAPALLLAYFGAGLLEVFMPRATVAWMRRGTGFSRSLRGVAFGLPLPVCSCGVIPLYRSLITRGAPAAGAIAFLVATPEIGIDAVLLSFPLLGSELTLTRVACAAIVAIIAGWVIGNVVDGSSTANASSAVTESVPDGQTPWQRLRSALRAGFGEVVDNTGPWILVGLGIAAAGAALLDDRWLRDLPNGLDIVLFALAGIPSYVCATGATPLVTMFIFKGLSPGAAIAFLLTGPATNATTFGVLARLHGPKIALSFGLLVASAAIALGVIVNQILPAPEVFPLAGDPHEHGIAPFKLLCLIALAAVYLLSLIRQGPRRFLGHVVSLDAPGGNEPPPSQSPCCKSST